MKRKRSKQLTGFSLLLSVALSLCACGRSARESEKENDALAKEHVYQFQEIEMPDFGGDEYEVCASDYRDGEIFLLMKVTDWEHYNDNDIRILSVGDDGSGAAVVPLETVPWNPAVEDGSGASENSSYENYTFGADGRIYAVRYYYREPLNPEKNAVSMRYLCCWTTEGRLLWETELEDCGSDDESLSVNVISVTEDGTASLTLTGEYAWQISVDAQGKASGSRQLSDETFQIFSTSAAVVHRTDGTLLLVCYGEDNWTEQYLVSYDPATDTMGESSQMPSSGWDGYGSLAAGPGSGLLYSNRTGIFSYAPQDTASPHSPSQSPEGTKVMDFINSDLSVSSFEALISLNDTSFAGLFYENYNSEASMGIFTYVEPADVPDRSVLLMAGCYISDDVMQRVVEFNRSSDQYRIIVQNVEEYDSEDELAAGITEMTSSVFSGNVPDILVTDGLPVETYAARGLLADIGELIEKDAELSQTDFLQNVFEAYSMDGKLYYVIPSFRVDTMIGASSVVGDRTSWTFTDAVHLLETLPEGTNLIPEANRSSFLQTMMAYCGSSFIDTGAGKCNFQSRNFLDLLEYARSLPEELDADSYGEDYWRNYEAQFRDGRTLLAGMPISSFEGIDYYVNGIFGEEVSYIGFPMEDGSGSYIRAEEAYAISAHSDHIEGAWEFLRYYLMDDYQSGLHRGLPVQKKVLLENSRSALSESQSYSTDNESASPEPVTEEQLKKLVTFLLSVNHCYYENEEIMDIVSEETGAFFAGAKTAEETAKVIQNRVQLYLDETMK
ncbi:MAG: extracellular solute-binding protein [Lachnospiraceae bacterium]|nr:extracellular solute-binding protein [Lachnospiraceae bacterium]